MTIRTILAAVSGGSASGGALELACRCAQRFGAHLEAFHAQPDPRDLFTYASGDAMGMSLSGEFVDRFIKDSEAVAAKTKTDYEAAVARHQIPVGDQPSISPAENAGASAAWRIEIGYGPTLVSQRARFFDLTVLGRSDRVVDQPHTDVVEQALIHSGRPVLLAPARAPVLLGETVAIGWNGSPEATRAVVGSLAFCAKANSVIILTIGDRHQDSAASLVDYLGWQGVAAKHQNLAATAHVGAGQQLLGAAHDAGADLLVMGAYGHVPWREFLLGGATREVVGASLLPVLLSH